MRRDKQKTQIRLLILLHSISATVVAMMLSGCVFKFEVPSAKTKLERQVLGYKPAVPKKKLLGVVTRSEWSEDLTREQLTKFRNTVRDEIVSAIENGLAGESSSGKLKILDLDKHAVSAPATQLARLREIVTDENFARSRLAAIEGYDTSFYAYDGVSGGWYKADEGVWEQR